MQSFSQRKGIKPLNEIVQVSGMNEDLRNSLWNALDVLIWSNSEFLVSRSGFTGSIGDFSRDLWFHYFKLPIDKRPQNGHEILARIRDHFFECSWNEVYDFLEYVVRDQRKERPRLPELLNKVLEREVAGYRFVSGVVTEITSEQEVAMLEEAMTDGRFTSVSRHLQRALELFSSRDAPDYRNSIKESISAVESMAKLIAGTPKATLPDALKILDQRGQIHPALREGFNKLYGYTSDEHGIRHAMLERPNVDADDARFFLLSCTSFINYLKARAQ